MTHDAPTDPKWPMKWRNLRVVVVTVRSTVCLHSSYVEKISLSCCMHKQILVLGRSSKRNRRSNILAAIEHNRNREYRKGKCDFDHMHFRCCTISVVRSQAISSVRTVQRSRQSMEHVDKNGRGGEGASTERLDYGHCKVISVNGSAV